MQQHPKLQMKNTDKHIFIMSNYHVSDESTGKIHDGSMPRRSWFIVFHEFPHHSVLALHRITSAV